ncbi:MULTISPECIES: carbohydrate ABC transporter permease [Streptomyces]|uniref:carbohydrate ABC transporter permease n=1 Tax=Streptomyces TaxID=1883 RepID=UPI0007EC478B|nr:MULTISPECIES: sugar ABC transporter permease [unclassified Streptomyces]MCP3767959.1 sugar ABC transporter permease [Streptomyces sp. MAR25Y5]OBQ53161.1 ABC transporter permease [Streptomyces sp. H-KF8]
MTVDRTAAAAAPPVKNTAAPAAPRRGRNWAPAFFLLPFFIPFILFTLVPVGYAFYQSLLKTERTGGTFGRKTTVFAGFEQYKEVLGDPEFLGSVGRVVLFGLVQIPLMLLLALTLALLLDSTVARLKRFFRIAYFVPYGIPGVIAALMWAFLYDPRLSPVVELLDEVGSAPDFLGSSMMLWSIGNIVTWTYTGYNMLIIYAALQAVPGDIYEAARMDGASEAKIAWRIKIPILRPALMLTGVFSIIGTLQLFTEPQVLRSISTSVTSTYTPNLAAYSLASSDNYSEAAAMSVTLALATFVLSFGFLKFTGRKAES